MRRAAFFAALLFIVGCQVDKPFQSQPSPLDYWVYPVMVIGDQEGVEGVSFSFDSLAFNNENGYAQGQTWEAKRTSRGFEVNVVPSGALHTNDLRPIFLSLRGTQTAKERVRKAFGGNYVSGGVIMISPEKYPASQS